MHSRDINEILSKFNEMRAVFVLGQRALPFLEEVFVFLREISPLLDEINHSIRESAERMPRATSQLQSVSEATELATTQILDLVDAVLEQLTPLSHHLERTGACLEQLMAHNDDAQRIASEAFAAGGITPPAALQESWDVRKRLLSGLQKECLEEQHDVADIRRRVSRIMMSLQVQDITAQQLASANHLIESIRTRMTALVERLGSAPAVISDESWPEYAAFDPHARYDADERRQERIDAVVLNPTPTPSPDETEAAAKAPVTDALIDQLFAACDAEPPRPSEARGQDSGDGQASQAEIDALFKQRHAS